MGEVESLLAQTAREFQPQIQTRLRGFFGGMIRHYLPQAWVFTTETETATLRVDADGAVSVVAGPVPAPDVTIEIPTARLVAALTRRAASAVPPGPLTVTPHTAKGKAAFDYLRSRLGL
ncbi:MAG TPA: hypothetical protein VMG99_06645 [Thermoplasmata archaeon]|jgi:hypothetical protein|nr:hypothetical protein [Thermoplasmata archaeon]